MGRKALKLMALGSCVQRTVGVDVRLLALLMVIGLMPYAQAATSCKVVALPEIPARAPLDASALEFEAERVEYEEGRYTLLDSVEGFWQDWYLQTDRLSWDAPSRRLNMLAPGALYAGQNAVYFNRAQAQLQPPRLALEQVRTILPLKTPARPERQAQARAEQVSVEDRVVKLERVHLSTCVEEDPVIYFKARRLEVDEVRYRLYHPVLFLGRVPVFYWPYLSLPAQDGRASGFLFPALGSSSAQGGYVSWPYYWNIAPALDVLVTPKVTAEAGGYLAAKLRYLNRSWGRGELEYETALSSDEPQSVWRWQHVAERGPWRVQWDQYAPSDSAQAEALNTVLSDDWLRSKLLLERQDRHSWLSVAQYRFDTLSSWPHATPDDMLMFSGRWARVWHGLGAALAYDWIQPRYNDAQTDGDDGKRSELEGSVSYGRRWGASYLWAQLSYEALWREDGSRERQYEPSWTTALSRRWSLSPHWSLKTELVLNQTQGEPAQSGEFAEDQWLSANQLTIFEAKSLYHRLVRSQRASLSMSLDALKVPQWPWLPEHLKLLYVASNADEAEGSDSVWFDDLSMLEMRRNHSLRWQGSVLYNHDRARVHQAYLSLATPVPQLSLGYNYWHDAEPERVGREDYDYWSLKLAMGNESAGALEFYGYYSATDALWSSAGLSWRRTGCCGSSRLEYQLDRDEHGKVQHQLQMGFNLL